MVDCGIMPAIDMNLAKAIQFFDRLKGVDEGITALKVGGAIVEDYGFIIASHMFADAELELPVCYDPQKRGTDVPFIIDRQVKRAENHFKPDFYIGSPLGAGSNIDVYQKSGDKKDRGSLEAFVEGCLEQKMTPIIVLEMTQPGSTRYSSLEQCEMLAKDAMDLGVEWIVAPATRPERLAVYRKIFDGEVNIVSPGNGPQKTGNILEDATTAVSLGADHLVIGRAIYNSANPVQTIKDVYAAIKPVHAERDF